MEEDFTNCKLIAIDIDGTLLTPDGQITPRTRIAIKRAQDQGIIVTLATARRYFNARLIANELGLDLPLVVYDGGLVVNHPAGTLMTGHPLDAETGRKIVDIFVRHHVQPIVQFYEWVQEEVWTGPSEHDNPELSTYMTLSEGRIRRTNYELLCLDERDLIRVVAFCTEEAIYPMLPDLDRLDCSWNMIERGNFGCAELAVMHPTCSKASGVAALASYYHIPLSEVMAIGDNNNDLEMLRTVGWGVAMGQAGEQVKAAARTVTASNSEEGVALAIERYALQNAPVRRSTTLFENY